MPVGTGDDVEAALRNARPELEFSVVSNPEFLREGAAIEDFKRPDRIIIGVTDPRGEETLRKLYRPLTKNGSPLLVMGRRAAELTKYASNAFLATKISLSTRLRIFAKRSRPISKMCH